MSTGHGQVTGKGVTQAAEPHDTYVYSEGKRWHWNCPCGATGGPFKRRMDADDDAAEHETPVRCCDAPPRMHPEGCANESA